ncbi:hypothetical protein TRIUR3_13354 [Triticum urartu]|uniref:Uncharacterized protein n=1 Tax=Triticum urartu TaxID=4572 RepID=M7YAG8_TRIUA|nr:hypothetical protein TRIUR3_13354 [Triticum urartu]
MMSLKPSASAAAEGCRIASTPRSALTARSTPLQVINILGNFVRIWSVYSLYSHLSSTGDSIVGFIFSCLVPASVIFLILQKPWKGRPLPNSQGAHRGVKSLRFGWCTRARFIGPLWLAALDMFCPWFAQYDKIVPTVVNGGVLALYFVLWAKGLLACRPLVDFSASTKPPDREANCSKLGRMGSQAELTSKPAEPKRTTQGCVGLTLPPDHKEGRPQGAALLSWQGDQRSSNGY